MANKWSDMETLVAAKRTDGSQNPYVSKNKATRYTASQ